MKTVQAVLKECDIKESLLVLLAGVPKKRFCKMLEQYYSLYCTVVDAWYEDGSADCILTDFRQSGYVDGEKEYFFYAKDTTLTTDTVDSKIDWDKVLLGTMKVYVPDCITEKTSDKILCPMFLHQMYVQSTVEVQKYTNKRLFEHIKALPREKKSNIEGCEHMLEAIVHYFTDKDYIKNAVLEYKESKGSAFKWGDLLSTRNWKAGIPDHIMYFQTGSQILDQALLRGGLPDAYRCFRRLDSENPPDLRRLYTRLKSLGSEYKDIELSDYLEVTNKRKRIIIENNVSCKKLPLIYIRDGKGEQTSLDDVEVSELLCMDIHVLDEEIAKPEQVLALIGFYMEYPIRVERIQRRYFIQALIGMKTMLIADDASEFKEVRPEYE